MKKNVLILAIVSFFMTSVGNSNENVSFAGGGGASSDGPGYVISSAGGGGTSSDGPSCV